MNSCPELLDVLRELYLVSGFRISVHNTHFQEIASYPESLSGFCGYIQKNRSARKLCLDADRRACEQVEKSESTYIYRCPFGLFEAAAPLYHFGILEGYLMMGQTLDSTEHSIQRVCAAARPYVTDEEALKQAVKNIPLGSQEKIQACFNIMTICSEYITLSHRLRLEESKLAPAVKRYLGEHFQQKITLDTLCAQFFCSKSTLSNTFKAAYKRTIPQHLTLLRLQKAQELLLHSNETVGNIAAACGFADQNYFSKVFQGSVGCSPTQFRTEHSR